MEITFSIIGTAGRNDDGKKLNLDYFNAMKIMAESLLKKFAEINYPITTVVSGGAAYADHVAVKLFLERKVPNLRIFMPCEWDGGQFKDNGVDDWKTNPGKIANQYHNLFQRKTGINSLSDIQVAKGLGAELIAVNKGFHARNALVAKSDFLLACTFGDKETVKDGGTADTVQKYLERINREDYYDKSYHYNLTDGNIYAGCKLPPINPKSIKNITQYKNLKSKIQSIVNNLP